MNDEQRIISLRKELERHNHSYYVLDKPTISDFEFDKLHSISTEGRQKLKAIQPKTIGQAARISGVSPSDINILLIYLGR